MAYPSEHILVSRDAEEVTAAFAGARSHRLVNRVMPISASGKDYVAAEYALNAGPRGRPPRHTARLGYVQQLQNSAVRDDVRWCEHCGSHVTAGEFDWVLSKIEQDEAYQ